MDTAVLQAIELIERCFDEGMTDGLPVVPPLRQLVERAVAASGRPADELVGLIPPAGVAATVEDIAVNAVMAGCRPEYLPVVLAAVRAMADDSFNWLHLATSTKGCAPLLVVNGPIRSAIGLNFGGNTFGPGHRANATIGRAIRLITINLGGSVSQVADKATLGHPGKFSYCIAEDEEDSPWEPYHVSRGFSREQSTVLAVGAEGPKTVTIPAANRPEAILACLADMMRPLGSYTATGPNELVAVIAKEHRDTLGKAGYTRRMIQEYLWEHAARPARELRAVGATFPPARAAKSDDEMVHLLTSPDDIHVIAAGGAGLFSAICHGFVPKTLAHSNMAVVS